jgi:glycosyltransferase involved in cell wall biosynthesis
MTVGGDMHTRRPALLGGMRVFPQIRAGHLDELEHYAPRRTLYLSTNYDLADRVVPSYWQRVTPLMAIGIVWRAQPESLELFEPFWRGFRLLWLALAVTQKCRARSRRPIVGIFAIENADLEVRVACSAAATRVATRWTGRALGLTMRHCVDRLACGTQASHELYASIVGAAGPESIITFDLLARRVSSPPRKVPLSAVFVGQLHERKGVDYLIRAWEKVEIALPGACLTIIGDGPLNSSVRRWSANRPTSRSFRGRLDHGAVLSALSESSVLAAPSVRHGRWREQVGDPMKEALAVGTTVVTTTETGIATWLSAHGHRVIPTPLQEKALVDALTDALVHPVSPMHVLASLPGTDGRLVADAWLHR